MSQRQSNPFSLLLLLLLLPVCSLAENLILFIGDGTGLAQMAAARLAAVGPEGRLAVDQLEQIGLVTTHSASGLTTDSAAGATAFATGHKTYNGGLAVDSTGHPLKTVLEYARDAGLGTGLVTTTSITHATPAAFAAHQAKRSAEAEIAAQLLVTRPHVMLGGGRAFWIPQKEEGSKRQDDLDLLEEARRLGYQVVETPLQLRQLAPGRPQYVLGLFAAGHLTYAYDLTDDSEPSLAEMTGFAIEVLKQFEKGFFLMVEGGRVDHACHAHDATRAIWEALALDQAIARGLEFARQDRRTLILFVADHETGGMSVANEYYEGFPQIPQRQGLPDRSVDLAQALRLGWTTGGHTGLPVIAAATGPGAEQVKGLLDNTALFAIAMKALKLEEARR